MKIFLILLLSLSFVKADEMSRIEAIVADITELRSQYNECKKELKPKTDNTLSRRIKELEKELKYKNNLLKAKDKTIKKLTAKQDNFPKLMMKDAYQNNKIEKKLVKEVSSSEILVRFKATSYHLKYDSIIYNAIDGKMMTKWVATTSFTSSVKTQNWIKVTGYFVNKQWRSAKKDMWIEIKQVEKK